MDALQKHDICICNHSVGNEINHELKLFSKRKGIIREEKLFGSKKKLKVTQTNNVEL